MAFASASKGHSPGGGCGGIWKTGLCYTAFVEPARSCNYTDIRKARLESLLEHYSTEEMTGLEKVRCLLTASFSLYSAGEKR